MWNVAQSPEQTNIITSSEATRKVTAEPDFIGAKPASCMLATEHSVVRRYYRENQLRAAACAHQMRTCMHSQSTIEV
jgi:hypothetical protein